MSRNLIFIFVMVTSGSKLFAQTVDPIPNTIVIHKDARLDILAKKEAQTNVLYSKALEKTTLGFRLQILSTTDRELVMRTKTILFRKFPEQKNYLIFQSPYIKLRFGNFKTKEDAEIYQKQITKLLNGISIYVIPDRIEVLN